MKQHVSVFPAYRLCTLVSHSTDECSSSGGGVGMTCKSNDTQRTHGSINFILNAMGEQWRQHRALIYCMHARVSIRFTF